MKKVKYLFSSNGICTRKDFIISFFECVLFYMIFYIGIISGTNEIKDISCISLMLYSFLVFIPIFAIIDRRLHDINKSSNYILLIFLPFGVLILLLLLMIKKSVFWQNKYIDDNNIDYNRYLYKVYLPVCFIISIVSIVVFFFCSH